MSTDNTWKPNNSSTRTVGTGGVLENRLVERAADGSVILAAAGSVLVDGVAKWTDATVGNDVTVERGQGLRVEFAAAAAPGTKLVAAATGKVTPAGATPDARTIVGKTLDNVAGAGLGSAYIYF